MDRDPGSKAEQECYRKSPVPAKPGQQLVAARAPVVC
jgi:hypothetical protein